MNADRWLFAIVVGLLGLTGWLLATRPEISLEDRKSMEEDWWG